MEKIGSTLTIDGQILLSDIRRELNKNGKITDDFIDDIIYKSKISYTKDEDIMMTKIVLNCGFIATGVAYASDDRKSEYYKKKPLLQARRKVKTFIRTISVLVIGR